MAVRDDTSVGGMMTAAVAWENERARRPVPTTLAAVLVEHEARVEKAGTRGWSAARYREGATRGNAGVEAVTAVVLDFDHLSTVDAADVETRLAAFRATLYTSYSHGNRGAEDHCFRVVVETSREMAPDEYRRVWPLVQATLGDHADAAAKDPARLWYVPACPAERMDRARLVRFAGAVLDVDALLARIEPPRPRGDVPRRPPAEGATRRERYINAAVERECEAVRTEPAGGRNRRLNRAAFALGQLVGAGALDEGEAVARLHEAATLAGLGGSESSATIASGLAGGRSKPRELPEEDEAPAKRRPPEESPDGAPFAPVEAYEETTLRQTQQPAAAIPFPLLLRYPGIGTTWLRTPDDRWVIVDDRTVRAEIADLWPAVPLWRDTDGGPKPITPAQLQELRGRRVNSVIYDLTIEKHRYEPRANDLGGDLVLACAPRDASVTPLRDTDCETWLETLGGAQTPKVLDWLATVTDLSQPTAALYLHGPKGAGKGLLASALARLWGRHVTSYAKICGRFNSAMRDCPIVFLDEGAPIDPSGSASFRSLVSERTRAIEDKGRPVCTLRGCVRLVIAANNLDALRIREDLTPDDEAAIGERILMIRIPADAAALLESMPRDRWVDDDEAPGKLVRHLAWLQTTREVRRGQRFIVAGDEAAWIRGASRRGGLQQEILCAIARLVSGDGGVEIDARETPVWVERGGAKVSVDRLQRAWCKVMPGSKWAPTLAAMGRALAVVAPQQEQIDVGDAFTTKRLRVRRVPAQAILDAATEAGIGDEDDLRREFELDG